jgi:hypothetical protein
MNKVTVELNYKIPDIYWKMFDHGRNPAYKLRNIIIRMIGK